jgi:hypothetical protein
MVEMAKLWGECAEDAERAEKKRIKVSAPSVNANVNAQAAASRSRWTFGKPARPIGNFIGD